MARIHWMDVGRTKEEAETFCGRPRHGMSPKQFHVNYKGVTCLECLSPLIEDYRAAGEDEQADALIAFVRRARHMTNAEVAAELKPDRQTRREQAFAAQQREQRIEQREYEAYLKDRQRDAGRKAAETRRRNAEAVPA